MHIELVTEKHISELTPLFDQYRVFYEQTSNLEAAKAFLTLRIKQNESVIFMAYEGEVAIGFTQLYTTFSSVSMRPFYVLNDLYVNAEYRKKGVGEALLNCAKKHCLEKGYKGLALETAPNNPAQHLYERLGWTKQSNLFYFWDAPKAS